MKWSMGTLTPWSRCRGTSRLSRSELHCALQPVPGVQVCTEAGEFCCMAEWTRLEGEEVFSLGVYSGPHYLDASVTGSWSLQMCTVIKVENCCY